jgi:general secretion pathway protein J
MNGNLAAQPESDAGFTLLELLVAITLLSLLSLALLGGLRFGARVWERSDQHNLKGSELRLAEAELRKHIERAWPFFDTSNPLTPHASFEGRADRLAFLTSVPDTPPYRGYMRIQFALEQQSGTFQLIQHMEPELSEDAAARRRVLAEGLTALRFSYFGKEARNKPSSWHDEWEGRTMLPALVRIEALHEGVPGGFQMIVAPRVQADAGCIYDPLTQFCRGR